MKNRTIVITSYSIHYTKLYDEELTVVTDRNEIPCDLVVLSAGVRPNTELARQAGIALGTFGGILVDRRMRSSDPDIFV